MRQLSWCLIGGYRGGETRLRGLGTLHDRPTNTNQLPAVLDVNDKTVQHHLASLQENDSATTQKDNYGKPYVLSNRME